MEFFDKLSETIVSAGKDVGQKAKDVSEIAKLKMDIRSKEDFVEKQYAELGKAYYEKHKDEENAETEEKTPEQEHFFLITEALGEIERMRAEVFKLQGATECPKCGAKCRREQRSAATVEQRWTICLRNRSRMRGKSE